MDEKREIAQLWYELVKTQSILQKVIENIEQDHLLSKKELRESEEQALRFIQLRYPLLGITWK